VKYLLIILDGAADEPLPELEQRTPLMAATKPVLDDVARRGRVGAVHPLWREWDIDPAAANLGLLGYDPVACFRGRGPFEAANLEVDLDRRDLAFRLDLISTDGERLLDPTGGRTGRREGALLISHLAERLRMRTVQFYPGTGWRNVMVWREAPPEVRCRDPQEVTGEPLRPNLPEGDRAERLHQLTWDSYELLQEHPINRRRVDEGRAPANMVWPWSPGPRAALPPFGPTHGLGGALVAGDGAVRGMGRLAGLEVVDVPGATGDRDSDFHAKARAALAALERFDFTAIHVAALHEVSLDGDYEAKIDLLQRIDQRLLGTIMGRIGKLDDFQLLVTSGAAASCAARRALPGWVPFVLAGSRVKRSRQRLPFDERAADEAEWRIDEPWYLPPALFEPHDALAGQAG
jgi:2,3-bisphosphoglycerate-independent phosphoglycerate mutase